MNSQEKSNFINHLRFHIKDSTKGFKYFLEKWEKLDQIDATLLKEPLLIMCIDEMKIDKSISSAFFEFQNVINYFIENGEYIPDIKKFTMTNAVNGKEITKIFYRLNKLNYIHNTNEEIAKLLSTLFEIKYLSAYNYLKNPKNMENTKDILS